MGEDVGKLASLLIHGPPNDDFILILRQLKAWWILRIATRVRAGSLCPILPLGIHRCLAPVIEPHIPTISPSDDRK